MCSWWKYINYFIFVFHGNVSYAFKNVNNVLLKLICNCIEIGKSGWSNLRDFEGRELEHPEVSFST